MGLGCSQLVHRRVTHDERYSLGTAILSIKTLSITTLSIKTLSITTLSVATFSITTHSIVRL
jgi:hypothetical protein